MSLDLRDLSTRGAKSRVAGSGLVDASTSVHPRVAGGYGRGGFKVCPGPARPVVRRDRVPGAGSEVDASLWSSLVSGCPSPYDLRSAAWRRRSGIAVEGCSEVRPGPARPAVPWCRVTRGRFRKVDASPWSSRVVEVVGTSKWGRDWTAPGPASSRSRALRDGTVPGPAPSTPRRS